VRFQKYFEVVTGAIVTQYVSNIIILERVHMVITRGKIIVLLMMMMIIMLIITAIPQSSDVVLTHSSGSVHVRDKKNALITSPEQCATHRLLVMYSTLSVQKDTRSLSNECVELTVNWSSEDHVM
jgi:hypothetical protein